MPLLGHPLWTSEVVLRLSKNSRRAPPWQRFLVTQDNCDARFTWMLRIEGFGVGHSFLSPSPARMQSMAQRGQYSIVVVGAMNPRIHTPHWYRFVEVLSEEELDDALSPHGHPDSPILTPPYARFTAGNLSFECQDGRWQVTSEHEQDIDRLAGIAAAIFDTALVHTPVSAFGVNLDYQIRSGEGKPMVAIARRLGPAFPFLPASEIAEAGLSWRVPQDGFSWRINLGPDTDGALWVRNNFHFAVEQVGQFELGPLIAEPLDRLRRLSDAVVRGVEGVLDEVGNAKGGA